MSPFLPFLFVALLSHALASSQSNKLHSSSIFQNYFSRYFPPRKSTALFKQGPANFPHMQARRLLVNEDDEEFPDDVLVSGLSLPQLRSKIAEHRVKLDRLKQESRDLAHERAFLEKTIQLKKGQRTMQDGQVKLSKVESEDKKKEIEMYKLEAPRTLERYNELVRKQKKMQETLNRLHGETEELSSSKNVIMDKIQHLNMEDLVERHARGLPDAMAGALRKSAAALIPFFDYLMIAADTNNRLVDHVGEEIDKYTHVNISKSPFLSGILFYCVLLIPLLTLISFIRRIFDSSSKLTVSHYIIFGNIYFVFMCIVNVIAAFVLKDDPMSVLYYKVERMFIISNLFLSAYYCWHVAILGLQAIYTWEERNISQLLATISVGIHYFLFAWRRIFTDHAPVMYTFNYLVYGTIFCFIVYERYNRMSSKQLNDSAIFRLVQIVLKRRAHLTTLRGFRSVAKEVWSSMASSSSSRQKGLSKRQDRQLTSERGKDKGNGKGRDKGKLKGNLSNRSEEDEDEIGENEHAQRGGNGGGQHKKSKPKQEKVNRVREARGFISIFFGSREDGDDSSDDDKRPAPPTGWRFFGTGSNAVASTTRVTGVSEATRIGRSMRNQRPRDKKEHPPRRSLWKWP